MSSNGGTTTCGTWRVALHRAIFAQVVLLCLAALVLPACGGNYRAGVQEWAQPTRDLLAQRIDEAMEMQEEAIDGLAQLPRRQRLANENDLYHQQVSLTVYRYGQSVHAIRDLLERQAAGEVHPEDRQPVPGTRMVQLADGLQDVHGMMQHYLAQQQPQATDPVETVSLAQLQQAARNARSDAQAMLNTLR